MDAAGGHPATALALDLADDADVFRWLLLACLLQRGAGEPAALGAFAALREAGLDAPDAVAVAPEAVRAALARSGLRRPEAAARVLVRASAGLRDEFGGSLTALAAGADDVFGLMERLAGLAPGVGRATVKSFLRPLRHQWPAALETPLHPKARAAAVELGWLAEGEDEEGEPGALARFVREAGDTPALADVEAALARHRARRSR